MADTRAGSVSETAHWVAAFRAQESLRPDAIFRDPFAARLAGKLGAAVPKGVPPWPMIMRTKLIDDLVVEAVARGTRRVLNLAAGLDTRPYRLPLAKDVRWIEADLPAMTAFKESALAGEPPACELVREKVDLAIPAERAAFLDRALDGADSALVLTEGLLAYLTPDTARTLSVDLYARPQIRSWVIDVASPGILKRMQKATDARLAAPDRMKFAPPNGVAFYEETGWKAREILSMYRAGVRYRRLPFPMRLFRFLPDPDPRNPGNQPWGAVVRLER